MTPDGDSIRGLDKQSKVRSTYADGSTKTMNAEVAVRDPATDGALGNAEFLGHLAHG